MMRLVFSDLRDHAGHVDRRVPRGRGLRLHRRLGGVDRSFC